ncbi:PAS domain-containing protein [Methylobacterium nonmethylotrophicum]|uniref:histidine kinase n=1 Tax=Methylobacterium nonmethylotrophicum TaxID=1141884 RepID=A0A4Z0NYF9_9HYPH|nr:PAS domain-containing protein [Methylobacterium nonmethylotrophicum]TGE02526.1 histidine kinase [Methylobacterium nonmethylotrophicum]
MTRRVPPSGPPADAIRQPDAGADILDFPDREFLRLIEAQGLTGSWTWTFATDEQAWSPGLFRLLGFEPGAVRADYGLFLGLVHPEDRPIIESNLQVMRAGIFNDHTVRVIRPDGSLRVMANRGAAYFTPDGRPRAVAGVMMDVTDAERLAGLRREDQRRRRALFEQAQAWTHASPYSSSLRIASRELLSLTGLKQQDFHDDWTRVIVPEERERARDHIAALLAAEKPFVAEQHLALVGGESGRFRGVFVPVRDGEGRIESWVSLNSRVDGVRPTPSGEVRRGLEQAVQGAHLRAARGLLDWSMADLAGASGLSLSTVRRLEEGGDGTAARSRHAAIGALRQAGIGFVLLEGSVLAVAKVR